MARYSKNGIPVDMMSEQEGIDFIIELWDKEYDSDAVKGREWLVNETRGLLNGFFSGSGMRDEQAYESTLLEELSALYDETDFRDN